MPTYLYRCPDCEEVDERYVPCDERYQQDCLTCGIPLKMLFAPTRSKHSVDSRSKSKMLKRQGLIALGDERIETVHKVFDQKRQERNEQFDRELTEDIEEEVSKMGGWDTFKMRDPTKIREQENAFEELLDPETRAEELRAKSPHE